MQLVATGYNKNKQMKKNCKVISMVRPGSHSWPGVIIDH